MRVLLALTYYRPHLSGLTIYVERLARLLADRGHVVTVLASRHERHLPAEEEHEGVRVVRVPVAGRIGKGVIVPALGREARRLLGRHDVLSLHLPQLDAAGLALNARLVGRPTVVTYHCDLLLPPGALNRLAEHAVRASNRAAIRLADGVVAYTDDYARHSPLLRRAAEKLEGIGPPVVLSPPPAAAVTAFRGSVGPPDRRLIGVAARFAAEKGIDVLVEAVRQLPEATVVFAGAHEGVPGEELYRRRLEQAIASLGDRWRFLGPLDPRREMPLFFAAVDCLAVPSVNSTESFGLVQVEAMLCGTPVVASDLPGVRQPVQTTGMGEVVPVGDAGALAGAIRRVLAEPARYARPRDEIVGIYDPARTAAAYESLFARLVADRGRGRPRAVRAHERT
jgi:glycosyltransferase involved in cell wall biosynthesis